LQVFYFYKHRNGKSELITPLSKKFVCGPVWANQLRGDGVTGSAVLLSDLGIPIKPAQTTVDVLKPVGDDVVTTDTLPELYKVAIVIFRGLSPGFLNTKLRSTDLYPC
jgi:hypothetical protein